jgi:hypothetical protein
MLDISEQKGVLSGILFVGHIQIILFLHGTGGCIIVEGEDQLLQL